MTTLNVEKLRPSTRRRLEGIVPPVVVPLKDGGVLDVAALERIVEHMVGGGVHGLFVNGTTGEAASLAPAVRNAVLETCVKAAAGRVPVLAAVTDNSVAQTLVHAAHAADAGADAVVVCTPFYLPVDQDELVAYASAVIERQSLPVYLYNIPFVTKSSYATETVVRLARDERVVGYKDSSGDMKHLLDVRRLILRGDFSVFVGQEGLLPEAVAGGCQGAVSGGANLEPRIFVDAFEAARGNDAAALAAAMGRMKILGKIYSTGVGVVPVIRGLKAAMELRGLCARQLAEPYRAANENELQVVRAVLAELDKL